MCWGKSTSFRGVLGQSICSWRPSKINLERDGNTGKATSEMAHSIWPSNPDRQILPIQVAWRNWTHPWAKSHLYLTKEVINGKRKGHSPTFEEDYEHFFLTIWFSCARKRDGAPEEKEGKGLDSICSRHMPLISIVSMANKILAVKSAFSLILYLGATDWEKNRQNLQSNMISAEQDERSPVKYLDFARLLDKT